MNLAMKPQNKQSLPKKDQSVLEINGRTSLKGEVQISGAKNSALAIMAGTLLWSR